MLVNLKDAANMLACSQYTLSDPRYRQRIGLKAVKIGRAIKFKLDDIEALISRGTETFEDATEKLIER